MSEFKIGDRVRVVGDKCFHGHPMGSEWLVSLIDEKYYKMAGSDMWFHDDDLEFISRPTPASISEEPANYPESIYHQLAVEIADLVTVKQAKYGDSFNKSGEVLRILYPEGVTPDQYDDFLAITRLLDKLFRIATDRDALGESPWRDINGYSLLSIARVERERTAKSN
jgi:hypothetical protein